MTAPVVRDFGVGCSCDYRCWGCSRQHLCPEYDILCDPWRETEMLDLAERAAFRRAQRDGTTESARGLDEDGVML